MEDKKSMVTSDTSEWIDLNGARDALLIDKHTILELVQQFLQDKAHYVEPLRGSLAQKDWWNLVAYAHRLKGTAMNLRVYGIGEPALDLEKAAEEQLQLIEDRFSAIIEIVEQS